VKFYFIVQTKKNHSWSNLSGCAKALCPFHSSTKVLSPAIDLIPRPYFFMTCNVDYLMPLIFIATNSIQVLVLFTGTSLQNIVILSISHTTSDSLLHERRWYRGLWFLLGVSMVHYCVDEPYYHAMRMHSADYAVARCLSVCPSVCHTPVFCWHRWTYPQFITVR